MVSRVERHRWQTRSVWSRDADLALDPVGLDARDICCEDGEPVVNRLSIGARVGWHIDRCLIHIRPASDRHERIELRLRFLRVQKRSFRGDGMDSPLAVNRHAKGYLPSIKAETKILRGNLNTPEHRRLLGHANSGARPSTSGKKQD